MVHSHQWSTGYLHTKEVDRCWHLMSCLLKKPVLQDSRLWKGSKWSLVAGQPSPSVNLSLSRKLSNITDVHRAMHIILVLMILTILVYSIVRENIAYTHGHGWMKVNLCRSVHKLHIPYLDIWVWTFLTWKQAAKWGMRSVLTPIFVLSTGFNTATAVRIDDFRFALHLGCV